MGKIAIAYIKKFLITDLLSCIPTLVTYNSNRTLYYLKLFKFIQCIRIFEQLKLFKRVLINRFMKDTISLHNVDWFLRSSVLAFIFFHVFTCGWIRIGVSYPDSWLYTQKLDQKTINVEYGFTND